MKKVAIVLLALLGLLVLAIAVTIAVFSETKPKGVPGPEADALARRIIDSTQPDAWAKTGAVQWTFAGRFEHLWDRDRDFIRVRWEPYEVVMRLSTQYGVVKADGQVVKGDRAGELLKTAYARWINDGFWLYPFDGIFAPNTQRALVQTEDHGPALLVTYGDGGLTPGDSYLWLVGEDGQPKAWKMWVSIIPIGGLEVSWDEWITLQTGARISTLHRGPFDLKIENVRGAATLAELLDGQPDPFAILETSEPPTESAVGPASAPASAPARTNAPAPAPSP